LADAYVVLSDGAGTNRRLVSDGTGQMCRLYDAPKNVINEQTTGRATVSTNKQIS
jgi:hypothetical protein